MVACVNTSTQTDIGTGFDPGNGTGHRVARIPLHQDSTTPYYQDTVKDTCVCVGKHDFERMALCVCHFSNLREWTNLLTNVTSSAKTLYIVFNFKVVYCEMQFGSPKHFACDMYVAYVMCLFALHATADICALTLATWAHPIN